MTKTAPSLLASDFSRLGEAVRACEAAGADYIHFDVMDGHFVPNITFGPQAVAACRPVSKIVFDVHLMIDRPDLYLDRFLEAGSDIVTIHVESPCDIAETIDRIRAAGRKPGITLRPGTPLSAVEPFLGGVDLALVMSVEPGFGGQAFIPESIERIATLRRLRTERGFSYEIEVDGGVDRVTGPQCVAAGADVLVAGSYLFKQPSLAEAIRTIKN